MSELSRDELRRLPLYRLDVAYIGTKFPGFQCQPGGLAIQDNIEHALSVFFRRKMKVVGASRTDTGVHAEGQVVTFRSDQKFDEHTWLRALNALTDPDIGIRQVRSVPSGFHPIYGAKGKAYRYRLWQGNCRSPFMSSFVWEVIPRINLELLIQSAAMLVGEHDFSSFCNADSSAKTRVRQIFEIFIDDRSPLIDIWVVGNGFLKQMVRIIVGTLVENATGNISMENLSRVLGAKNRVAAGKTAPARGLSLVEIFYDQIPSVAHLIEKARGGFTQFHC